MPSIEEKLKELVALAGQLDEAKKAEDVQASDDIERDVKDADKDGDKSEVKDDKQTDTSDEPEGSTKEQIVDADEDESEDKKVKTNESAELPKIDLGALFEGEELSEDFKLKVTAVFEAAVETRVAKEVAELKESLAEEALNEATALEESLVEKVDGYLDYMVEQWMEKNALAVNRGIKTEILESFVGGMKEPIKSHQFDVPDEK